MTQQPLLSLAMMVKNEERFLEGALLSARGWVDEMVVVDTGSTDRTVEIARDLGAVVSHFEWVNDFSKARNETLRRARGAWVAILDADERYRGPNPSNIRQLLRPSAAWPYQALMLNVVNVGLNGAPTHSFFSQRIFPRHPDLGYAGRVHNAFCSLSDPARPFEHTQVTGLEIVHLGYDPEIYRARDKLARNLALLELAAREEPEVPRYRFYLGREYALAERHAEAQATLLSVVNDPAVDDRLRVEASTAYLMSLHAASAPLEARLAAAVSTLERAPREPDAWLFLSYTYEGAGLEREAMEALEEGLGCLSGAQLHTCRLAARRGERALALSRWLWGRPERGRAARWAREALEHTPSGSPERPSALAHAVEVACVCGSREALSAPITELVEELAGCGGPGMARAAEALGRLCALDAAGRAALGVEPRALRATGRRLAALHPALGRDARVQAAQRL
jgi:hypothetical protein